MRKNTLTKKEKKYIALASGIIILALLILVTIAYSNLFGSKTEAKGRIQMVLQDSKIVSGEETRLTVTVKNTGKSLLEGNLVILADDLDAVNVSHEDPSVLNVKLYPEESVTRVLKVVGQTNAIRTDYKITAEIKKDNETVSSNELVLTVTKD